METNEKTQKELELERKQKYHDNLQREVAMFKEQLPEVQQRLDLHLKTIELVKKNHKIMIDNFVFKDPKWGYEEIPEYIENVRQLNILNFERTVLDWDKQTLQFQNNIDSIIKQVTLAESEIVKVTKELEELKGE